MDLIGKDCRDLIYKYKHQLQLSDVLEEFRKISYTTDQTSCIFCEEKEWYKNYLVKEIDKYGDIQENCWYYFTGIYVDLPRKPIRVISMVLGGYRVIESWGHGIICNKNINGPHQRFDESDESWDSLDLAYKIMHCHKNLKYLRDPDVYIWYYEHIEYPTTDEKWKELEDGVIEYHED